MSQFLISSKESRIETNRSFYGSFLIGPFHPSESLTVATALRRSLLSELPGIAIISVQIEGATHEYSNIPGVRDSVLDILLNLREVVLKKLSKNSRPQVGYLRARGPGIITAGDLCLPPFFQCVDPQQHIATLADDGVLNMKFIIAEGTNYIKGKPKIEIDIHQFKKRRFILKKLKQTYQTKMNPSYLDNYYLYLKKQKSKKLIRSNSFLNLQNEVNFAKNDFVNPSKFSEAKFVGRSEALTSLNKNAISNAKNNIENNSFINQNSQSLTQNSNLIIKRNSLNRNLLNVDAVFNPIINVNYIIEINEHKILEKLFEKTNKIQNRLSVISTTPILMNSESFFTTPKVLKKSISKFEKENLHTKLKKAKPFLILKPPFHENKGENLNSLKKLLQYQINFERFKYLTSKRIIGTGINLKTSWETNKSKNNRFGHGLNYEGSLQPVLNLSQVQSLPLFTTKKSIKSLKRRQENLLNEFYNYYSVSETGIPLNESENNINIWSNEPKKDNIFHNNIILEVWTNGSLHPREAIYEALSYLLKLFSKLRKIKAIEPLTQFEATNIDFLTELKNNSHSLFPLSQTNFLGKYATVTSNSLEFRDIYKNQTTFPIEIKKIKQTNTALTKVKELDPNNLISQLKFKLLDISTLKIGVRPLLALKKIDITTIGQLIELKKEELLKIPFIGKKSVAEIEKNLLTFGLSLKI